MGILDFVGGAGSDTLAGDAGYDWLRMRNQGAKRDDPLHPNLTQALDPIMRDLGVTFEVFSGGQENQADGTGSTRHNHGKSADGFFLKNGRKLSWNNPADVPVLTEIVQRSKAAGLVGQGSGKGYMLPNSFHMGFGNPAVWGKGGKGANADPRHAAAYNGTPMPSGAGSNTLVGGAPAQPPPRRVEGVLNNLAPGGPQNPTLGPTDQPVTAQAGMTRPAQRPGGYTANAFPALGDNVQSVAQEGTGNFNPSSFQRLAARQAVEGDQSQLQNQLAAAGLDPTGKRRLTPRGVNQPGIMAAMAPPAADPAPGGLFSILANLFKG